MTDDENKFISVKGEKGNLMANGNGRGRGSAMHMHMGGSFLDGFIMTAFPDRPSANCKMPIIFVLSTANGTGGNWRGNARKKMGLLPFQRPLGPSSQSRNSPCAVGRLRLK
jgi:hypothetical protein